MSSGLGSYSISRVLSVSGAATGKFPLGITAVAQWSLTRMYRHWTYGGRGVHGVNPGQREIRREMEREREKKRESEREREMERYLGEAFMVSIQGREGKRDREREGE